MGALSVSEFVDLMVGGLAIGCVYSLIALGFAMIMRATNIIHRPHPCAERVAPDRLSERARTV